MRRDFEMFIVNDDPFLFTSCFVGANVLVYTPVTAPPTRDTATARHTTRELFDNPAVIKGEVLRGHNDMIIP